MQRQDSLDSCRHLARSLARDLVSARSKQASPRQEPRSEAAASALLEHDFSEIEARAFSTYGD